MSGRIGESSHESWSVTVKYAPVVGKQAPKLEGHLYPKRLGSSLPLPFRMVHLGSGRKPLTEVSNTVRLANVSVALYRCLFEALYKTTCF